MNFDADAFREAHRPWSFTLHGRTFEARPVSAGQVAEFLAAQLTAEKPEATPADKRGALREFQAFLRRLFPWRLSYWWRGDPALLLTRLDPVTRGEAIKSFFESLGVRRSRPPATSGMP